MLQSAGVIEAPEVRYVRNGGGSLAYQLVGTELGFDPRGTETLRGVPGTWHVFALRDK